jgi:hypothetical protein
MTLFDKIDVFINASRKRTYFAGVLNEMRESLALSDSDLYKAAQVSKSYHHKIMGPARPHPGKGYVFAYGLTLINEDTKKNHPPLVEPETRMNKLLEVADYSQLENYYFEEILTILGCLREEVYDVIAVNFVLDQRGLSLLPRGQEVD